MMTKGRSSSNYFTRRVTHIAHAQLPPFAQTKTPPLPPSRAYAAGSRSVRTTQASEPLIVRFVESWGWLAHMGLTAIPS